MSASTRLLPAVATVGLFALSACGSEAPAAQSPTTSASPTPTPTAPAVPAPSTPPTTTATKPAPADITVDVTIAGKKVTTSQPVVKAKAGQKVLINATSDVSDSLHVHGYDKTLELKPGKAASLLITTGMKGLFEVETHESGKLVFKLQVS